MQENQQKRPHHPNKGKESGRRDAGRSRSMQKKRHAREDAYMKEGMQENRQRKTTPTETKRGEWQRRSRQREKHNPLR